MRFNFLDLKPKLEIDKDFYLSSTKCAFHRLECPQVGLIQDCVDGF